ncbi:MAG: DNA-binding protein [Desulfurococcales archaeon]|nr:DNA-binding protein [Desulfurococcales archaeon]
MINLAEPYDEDAELEEIRRRKLEELQRRAALEEERKRRAEAEALKQEILRRILTPKARERLANVKLVRPELAEFVENQLVALAQTGRLNRQIDDEELKEILADLASKLTKEYRFRFQEKK